MDDGRRLKMRREKMKNEKGEKEMGELPLYTEYRKHLPLSILSIHRVPTPQKEKVHIQYMHT